MQTSYRNPNAGSKTSDTKRSSRYLSWAYLESIAPGNTAFFYDMMRIFRDNAKEQIRKIEQCYREGSLTALANEAHDFKPMGEYLGVNVLGTLSVMIERKASTGKVNQIPALIFQLKQVTDCVLEEIDQMMLGAAA